MTATESTTVTIGSSRKIYTNYEPGSLAMMTLLGKRADPIPSYVSQYPVSQISEACSCVLTTLTSTMTRTPFAIRTRIVTLNVSFISSAFRDSTSEVNGRVRADTYIICVSLSPPLLHYPKPRPSQLPPRSLKQRPQPN